MSKSSSPHGPYDSAPVKELVRLVRILDGCPLGTGPILADRDETPETADALSYTVETKATPPCKSPETAARRTPASRGPKMIVINQTKPSRPP